MTSKGPWASGSYCVCPECGERVEVLNGDANFSINVHLLSHKTEKISLQERNLQMRMSQASSTQYSNYTCPECKENIEIYNNDLVFSIGVHAEKHKPQDSAIFPDDQRSNASDTSRKSSKKIKENNETCEQSNILDAIFNAMPPGLKSHKGFIIENKIGKAMCTICNIIVEPKLSVSEHLKTKAHEDNTVRFLKDKIPTNLHDMLEFVSFYGSNLCCNLCRCKVELCSLNPFETIVNIIGHNSSKDHLTKKTDCNSQMDGGRILKSLALVNPLINENKHVITYNVQLQFTCIACNKNMGYHVDENELIKGFIAHLSSSGHTKCSLNKAILDSFNALHPGKKDHNFAVSKNGILCTVCNSTIPEANLERLILHSKQPNVNSKGNSDSIISQLYTPSTSVLNSTFLTTSPRSPVNLEEVPIAGSSMPLKTMTNKEINLRALISTLPKSLKNVNCIIENNQGQVTCLICECSIPISKHNLETHLLGSKHKNKEKTTGASNLGDGNLTLPQPVNVDCKKPDKKGGLKELFRLIPSSLQINMGLLKMSPNEVNQVHCSVCNSKVPANSKNLQEHLEGSQHVSSLKLLREKKAIQVSRMVSAADEDILLKNLQTDYVFKGFAKFLEMKDSHYFCKLCKSSITRSVDVKLSRTNLLSHATEQKHKKNLKKIPDELFQKLKLSNSIISSNSTYLQRHDDGYFCTVCGCTIPLSAEETNLEKSLMSHLTGNKHAEKKEKLLTVNSVTDFVDLSLKKSAEDTIIEWFKELPPTLQDDMQYFKRSSIEGYLSCELCMCIINPCYIKEHLIAETHVQKKTESRESYDLITF
uniref:C2H2-type domain-containing protein n=1 Tax=Graphocephala atropunctata TaxID=36148 RepID=A0A1B6MA24_9HEMI